MGFSQSAAGPYDIDLAFTEQEADEDAFTCLQHFSAPEEQLSLDLHNSGPMSDTAMMGPDDFTDFSRWIDGMHVAMDPCAYCRRMRIHCKIINEGLRKGSCTSCVALARSCSLTYSGNLPNMSNTNGTGNGQTSLQSWQPEEAVDEADDVLSRSHVNGLNVACDACSRRQGSECKVSTEGDGITCTNCLATSIPCSLNPLHKYDYWKLDDDKSLPPIEPSDSHSRSASASNLASLGLQSSDENLNETRAESNPKVGARFSRASVRILRSWLSTHTRHPYPSDEEKESLQRQTGLNKTQITNWLANARRRGKVQPPRPTSPSVTNYSNAMDIPRTIVHGIKDMNPLERWEHSPPEHEPASATAIAKAITTSTFGSDLDSPLHTIYGRSDDGSNRSLFNVSSTSSLGTSHSSGSFASAFSHKSKGSFGSFGSFGQRGRRRRRKQVSKPVKVQDMNAPARTFQCTFCTETFKTKHDWQRHEKSLHLSLERWVCCPNGPIQFCVEYDHNRCVFCGLPNPPRDHAEIHNYSSCADRSLEERTFYRKDHLRQHLNLVHEVKFQTFSMDSWKVNTPEIRSRCGFCGIVMDSWSIRVDHLAEHFKGGKSMADWKGDWGFEQPILDLVENGIPPCKVFSNPGMCPY